MNKFKYDDDYSYSIMQCDFYGECKDLDSIETDWNIQDNLNYFVSERWFKQKLSCICLHALKHFQDLPNSKNAVVIKLRKNYE